MTFLPVAGRELRIAARQESTYRIRWITGVVFLALFLWLLWVMDRGSTPGAGPHLFRVVAFVTFLFCVVIGAALPADCLSRERREGTLGLLFLTNLNSAEVVAGKVFSTALAAGYGLLAVFPLLAVTLLLGGVPFDEFWRVALALVNALFCSVALGTLVSAISIRQFPAMALAIGVALFINVGVMGITTALSGLRGVWGGWVEWIGLLSPSYAWSASDDTWRRFGANRYWTSVAAVWLFAWACLAFSAWWLSRSWRERGTSRAWPSLMRFGFGQGRRSRGQTDFRRRLLEINPFFWLEGRRRVSSPVFLLLAIILVAITVYGVAPYFIRVFGGGMAGPLEGHMFAWFWGALGIHGLVLYYAAMAASRGLAEDKQSGALELVLSTPVKARTISHGLWLAYARRMFAPMLIATLVHGYFLWLVAHAMLFDSNLPFGDRGTTPLQLLSSAWFSPLPLGFELDWHLRYLLRVLTLVLVVAMANWFALGWVGRWLGLRMKRPGLAPISAVLLVLVPPWLLFSLLCYLTDRLGWNQIPDQHFLGLMMWIGFAFGIGHAIAVSAWAAARLHHDFRSTVTGWFPVRLPWRKRLPGRRTLLRFAAGLGILALMVPGFHGYQNWQCQRAWTAFERELHDRGESLDLATILPGPVPDALNLARFPAFQDAANPEFMAGIEGFIEMPGRIGTEGNAGAFAASRGAPWIQQNFRHLTGSPLPVSTRGSTAEQVERQVTATALLTEMESLTGAMDAMTEASLRPYFQHSTDRSSAAVLTGNRQALATLERWQFLFHLRASARLATNHSIEAGEDLLCSLRLARLARQSPDLRGSTRTHMMVIRSLQPLWEGLAERRWSEAQLAAFQAELASFDFLSDHTNAVHRLVLSHIELWRMAAETGYDATRMVEISPARQHSHLQWQPRGWWLRHCIVLHRIGRRAIERVDVAAARVRFDPRWYDFGELPLDSDSIQLLHQWPWHGAHPALVAFAQTAVNQGLLACALDQHFEFHGTYPDRLDQLHPGLLQSVPHDVLTGRPLIYNRTDDGRYALRGVGPDGFPDSPNTPGGDDWLWAYPIPQPP